MNGILALKDLTKNFGIGFDDVFKRMDEASVQMAKQLSYPPYNIVKLTENRYVIELAVAGFAKQDIDIELQDGVLKVHGATKSDESSTPEYLYHGIAARNFTRMFTIADTVEVKNAELLNGILKIYLDNLVEMKKPKKIDVVDKSEPQLLKG